MPAGLFGLDVGELPEQRPTRPPECQISPVTSIGSCRSTPPGIELEPSEMGVAPHQDDLFDAESLWHTQVLWHTREPLRPTTHIEPHQVKVVQAN